jgi:hypothetical protein
MSTLHYRLGTTLGALHAVQRRPQAGYVSPSPVAQQLSHMELMS